MSGLVPLARLHDRWRQLPAGARSRLWGLLGVLAVLGLLVAFHQVVRGAVARAELRRAQSAVHSVAAWRCTTLGAAPQRNDCLAALGTDPAMIQVGRRPADARPTTLSDADRSNALRAPTARAGSGS